MKLIPSLFVLLLFGCSSAGDLQQSCKILDPDLAQGIYRGGCKDGWADGYGEVNVYENSGVNDKSGDVSSYRGDFLAGKKHGKGIKVMPNGDRYTGDFLDDYRDGRGVYVWSDRTPWAGNRYEGEYRRDLRSGWGVYMWSSGDRYEGPWENDLRMGPSVMELRRQQAAEAVARSLKAGAMVCAEEKWDMVNIQHIRGMVEGVADKKVQVRIAEVEGGMANHQGATLTTGTLLVDDVAHWQLCGQN